MSFGFAFEIIVERSSGVTNGEIAAVDWMRLMHRLQSPSLPS